MNRLIPRIIYWFWRRRFALIYKLGGKVMGARALVFQDDQVLLAKHTYIEGWFTLGGMVDRNETPLAAIKRELIEEAGIQIIEDPILLSMYHNVYQDKDDYVFLYIVKSFKRLDNITSPEIEECRFFPLDALPEDISAATRRRIQEYLGKMPISYTW